jgi:Arc/MetJ-type ribon-helix-helix transcriptional regulator
MHPIYVMKMGNKLLLNMPDKDMERIETLVRAGEYATKSEFIRFAVKQLLYSEARIGKLAAAASKLQKQTKSRKQVEKEIEWAKAGTRRTLTDESSPRDAT